MTPPLSRSAACEDHPAPEHALEQFGALPWRKSKSGLTQVLLITSRKRGRWIVPKGWPVKNRASYLAAALEAFEEAGVIGEIQPSSLAAYHYMKEADDGSLRLCRVDLFALKVLGTLTNWPERGQRKRKWVALADAAQMVDDAELGDILRLVQSKPEILTAQRQRFADGATSGCSIPRLDGAVPSRE